MCLFFHIGLIFAKPFVNSCQNCHFVKPTISCQDAPFWHLYEYLAKPFKNTLNFPFSYNCHLARFPSLWPHLSFCQSFEGFMPDFPFSQIGHFREISNGKYASFLGLFCQNPCCINFYQTFHTFLLNLLFSRVRGGGGEGWGL